MQGLTTKILCMFFFDAVSLLSFQLFYIKVFLFISQASCGANLLVEWNGESCFLAAHIATALCVLNLFQLLFSILSPFRTLFPSESLLLVSHQMASYRFSQTLFLPFIITNIHMQVLWIQPARAFCVFECYLFILV